MIFRRSGLGIALGIGLLSTAMSAQAIQFADGTTSFSRPPQLLGAATTFNTAYFLSATYYFTLTLPENAGEPLQKVVIAQEEGPDRTRFDLSVRDTKAFEGTRDRLGARLPLKEVSVDPKTRAVTVIFDPPVAPGRSITIELYPVRNPDTGGVYLYGVTAFPRGEKARGQFLGFGRIHIYDMPRGIFPFRYRSFR